jgi:hypothetical protein
MHPETHLFTELGTGKVVHDNVNRLSIVLKNVSTDKPNVDNTTSSTG